MAYYPISATGLNYITYPAGPTPDGLTVTSSGSTNTKGTYGQFVASSPFACNWVAYNTIGSNVSVFLFDIATGAAASEVVILPDNLASDGVGTMSTSYDLIPCAIAISTRIAGRTQASGSSQALGISLQIMATGGVPGVTSYVNYGATTATSLGTQIDPGASANTKGAYVQLTASTSAVIQVLMGQWSLGTNNAPATYQWNVDIATGAGGAEVVLIPDITIRQQSTAHPGPIPNSRSMLTYIAASTRIAARASCGGNDATDRLLQMLLLAGTSPGESGGSAGGAWAYA